MTPAALPVCPVLVFDRSDPTGVGGLQGAVLTLAALGCVPLSVVTAIGCGDTRGLESVYPLDPEWVFEQARALLEDIQISAILVGDPGDLSSLGAIAEIAADYAAPLVFAPGDLRETPDPDDGDDLAAAGVELLVPQAAMLVVDSTTACRLVDSCDDEAELRSAQDAARLLVEFGAGSVLLADGRDAAMQAVDTLFDASGVRWSCARRPPARPISGSLTTFAAAVAAGLARGRDLVDAVQRAGTYLEAALAAALSPGMGAAQPDRLAPLRRAQR